MYSASAIRNRLMLAALCVPAVALVGCGHPAGELFPAPQKALRWPEPPEPARVRYVGQLATSADLKPAVSSGQALRSAVFGKEASRSMLTPFAVCTDGGQRLFVADSNAQLVHVFDLQRRQYAQWTPAPQRFSQPVGIAWDPGGRLLVSDSVAGVVWAFDAQGRPQGCLGQGVLTRPCGLAVERTSRQIFIADAGAHQVVVLTPEGNVVTRVGELGNEPGQFHFPTAVALDSQRRLYVSDSLNFRVQQFSPDLQPLRQIGRKGDLPGYFSLPKGLAVDSDDHLYVLDAQFEAVQLFDAEGRLLMDFGHEGTGPGEFWLPTGIWIDPANRIWIADSYNRRIQVFDYIREEQP